MSAALAILVLLVGVPLNFYVFVKLRSLSVCAPHVRVLRERALLAFIVFLIVVVFGIIFVNNDMAEPMLAGDVTKLITRLAVLVLAIVPACYWLWVYR